MSTADEVDFFELDESKSEAAAALCNSSHVALYALATGTSMFIARRRLLAHIADAPEPEYVFYAPSRNSTNQHLLDDQTASSLPGRSAFSHRADYSSSSPAFARRHRIHMHEQPHSSTHHLSQSHDVPNPTVSGESDGSGQSQEPHPNLHETSDLHGAGAGPGSSNTGASATTGTEASVAEFEEHFRAHIRTAAANGPIVAYIRPPTSASPNLPPPPRYREYLNTF